MKTPLNIIGFMQDHYGYYANLLRELSLLGQPCHFHSTPAIIPLVKLSVSCPVVYSSYPDERALLRNPTNPLRGSEDVIIDEIYGHFLSYAGTLKRHPRRQMAMLIHNIHDWIRPGAASRTVREQGIRLCRRRILQSLDGLIPISPLVAHYLSRLLSSAPRPPWCVPFYIPNQREARPTSGRSERLRLTIPGGVDPIRRDYDSFFTALAQMSPATSARLDVNFLGIAGDKAQRWGLHDKIKAALGRAPGLRFTTHRTFVPASDFASALENTDLLLCNLTPFFQRAPNTAMEIYGISKESGIGPLAVEFALPLCAPSWLALPDYLEPATLRYGTTADLGDLLTRLVREGVPALTQAKIKAVLPQVLPRARADLGSLLEHFTGQTSARG